MGELYKGHLMFDDAGGVHDIDAGVRARRCLASSLRGRHNRVVSITQQIDSTEHGNAAAPEFVEHGGRNYDCSHP